MGLLFSNILFYNILFGNWQVHVPSVLVGPRLLFCLDYLDCRASYLTLDLLRLLLHNYLFNTTGLAGGLLNPYKGFISCLRLEGAPKVCLLHHILS